MKRLKAQATLQFENDLTIITRWDFIPNSETGFHEHKYDYVVVPIENGDLLMIDENGKENTVSLLKGSSYFKQTGVRHNVVSTNDSDFSFIEIEYKDRG